MNKFRWIYYVARRFSRVDGKGKSSVTSIMPAIGIGFGVMALIVIMSVMNGFQRGSIDALVELSSYHIRGTTKSNLAPTEILEHAKSVEDVISVTPFYEAQGLLVGRSGKQSASILRAVPTDVRYTDYGFAKELNMYLGQFNLAQENSIVLGWKLAQNLGVQPGDVVNILALSGGSDVDLFSDDREFCVTGVFSCGYTEINNLYAFISIDTGKKMLGEEAKLVYGIKVKDSENESNALAKLSSLFPNAKFESWRNFNKSFYGALRIEKNVLMLLVVLIFIVVAVNIFNGMRRMVQERREEICVLSALGGSPNDVQKIFILRGFLIGFFGALPGMIAGLLLSVRIDVVFTFIANVIYYAQLFFTSLVSPDAAGYVRQNSVYLFYAQIPARVFFSEVVYITLFGIFSSVAAAWIASRKTLSLRIAEVLRDE